MKHNDDKDIHDYRNEALLLTGTALVGGAKLAYDVSKEVYSRFKSEEKLFIQLLSSKYIDESHLLEVRLASAHIHGVHIETLSLSGKNHSGIEVYYTQEKKIAALEKEDAKYFSYPHLLIPGDSVDVYIKIPRVEDKKAVKNNGVKLACSYSSIDCLGKTKSLETDIRLKWE